MASAFGSARRFSRKRNEVREQAGTSFAFRGGRNSRLAATLVLAYTAVIVFASLQPFEGWRMPPREILLFLVQPWPRYTTTVDLVLNALVYFPLGLCAFVALKRRCGEWLALALAVATGTLLSLALESVQMFLPSRVASNLDLALNAAGTLAGAVAGWIFTPPRWPGERLVQTRQRQFVSGKQADVGLTLLAAWLALQLLPGAPVFALGHLPRRAAALVPQWPHSPENYIAIETGIVAATVIAIGCLVTLWLAREAPPLRATLLTLALALALRSIAAVMARDPNPLPWITPGTLIGIVLGIGAFASVARTGFRLRAALGALALACIVIATNIAPDNPYVAVPGYATASELTHLASLATLLRFVSDAWPAIAFLYLAALAVRRGPVDP